MNNFTQHNEGYYMNIPARPLGLIMNVVAKLGLKISYAYKDLAFVEENAFLFRMEDVPENISLFFNEAINRNEKGEIEDKIIKAGKEEGLTIICKGTFSIKEALNQKITILFNGVLGTPYCGIPPSKQ